TSGTGTLFFRPQDVVLVEDAASPALEGRVATSRRLAGTRIADLDIGKPGSPHHVEIEVPLEATAATGATIRFRPTRWKMFAE
ncbi:MAG: TOBE-like domain-containing protein, partial [Proteobacteria bacterium]|nr:TOBE-like domain-containing protein [Pseudomonadota bacterium]